MGSVEETVKELLGIFLHQYVANKMEAENGEVKVYKVGDNLVRIDIILKEVENGYENR